MSKKVMLETVDKEVVFYDNNEVLLEGRLFKVSLDSHEKTEDIVQDICRKLKTNVLDLVDFKYGSLLALHRVLYS